MGSTSWMWVSPMGLSSSSLMEVCPSNSLCWFLPMNRAYVRHGGSETQDTDELWPLVCGSASMWRIRFAAGPHPGSKDARS